MEYRRCIKITDNKLTDLREYTESLVNVDTDDSGWGWDSQVTLQARIKDAIMKMCSDRAIRFGTYMLPLMTSDYALNTDGTYHFIYLTFGYYTDDGHILITITADFNNNKVSSNYAEV